MYVVDYASRIHSSKITEEASELPMTWRACHSGNIRGSFNLSMKIEILTASLQP